MTSEWHRIYQKARFLRRFHQNYKILFWNQSNYTSVPKNLIPKYERWFRKKKNSEIRIPTKKLKVRTGTGIVLHTDIIVAYRLFNYLIWIRLSSCYLFTDVIVTYAQPVFRIRKYLWCYYCNFLRLKFGLILLLTLLLHGKIKRIRKKIKKSTFLLERLRDFFHKNRIQNLSSFP